MKTIWIVLISVLVTGVLVGGGTYYIINVQTTKDKDALQAQITDLNTKVTDTEKSLTDVRATLPQTTIAQATADKTVNWKSYTNTKYGYSFKYPSNIKITASDENSDDLAISDTAGGVNLFPANDTIGNGIFFVKAPGIDLTTTAIKNQFSTTKAEDITITSTSLDGVSGYATTIQNDSSVVSTFYYFKNTVGTVLELTVLNSSSDAKTILSSFQITK